MLALSLFSSCWSLSHDVLVGMSISRHRVLFLTMFCLCCISSFILFTCSLGIACLSSELAKNVFRSISKHALFCVFQTWLLDRIVGKKPKWKRDLFYFKWKWKCRLRSSGQILGSSWFSFLSEVVCVIFIIHLWLPDQSWIEKWSWKLLLTGIEVVNVRRWWLSLFALLSQLDSLWRGQLFCCRVFWHLVILEVKKVELLQCMFGSPIELSFSFDSIVAGLIYWMNQSYIPRIFWLVFSDIHGLNIICFLYPFI